MCSQMVFLFVKVEISATIARSDAAGSNWFMPKKGEGNMKYQVDLGYVVRDEWGKT